MKTKKGFSLLELMIVVAIIGIIVAIAFVPYRNYVIRTEINQSIIGAVNLVRDYELAMAVEDYADMSVFTRNLLEIANPDATNQDRCHLGYISTHLTWTDKNKIQKLLNSSNKIKTLIFRGMVYDIKKCNPSVSNPNHGLNYNYYSLIFDNTLLGLSNDTKEMQFNISYNPNQQLYGTDQQFLRNINKSCAIRILGISSNNINLFLKSLVLSRSAIPTQCRHIYFYETIDKPLKIYEF